MERLRPSTPGYHVFPQALLLKEGQDEPFLYWGDERGEAGIAPLDGTELGGIRTRLADPAAAQGQDLGGVGPTKGIYRVGHRQPAWGANLRCFHVEPVQNLGKGLDLE